MGTVIRFPLEQRIADTSGQCARLDTAASIVILPVVRIDRDVDEPNDRVARGRGGSAPRGRRPRSSRT
jgi:hypothetical protein